MRIYALGFKVIVYHINEGNAVDFQGLQVFRGVALRQNAAMHSRVQGLDPPWTSGFHRCYITTAVMFITSFIFECFILTRKNSTIE